MTYDVIESRPRRYHGVAIDTDGVEQYRTRTYQTRLSALSALYKWAYGEGVLAQDKAHA